MHIRKGADKFFVRPAFQNYFVNEARKCILLYYSSKMRQCCAYLKKCFQIINWNMSMGSVEFSNVEVPDSAKENFKQNLWVHDANTGC